MKKQKLLIELGKIAKSKGVEFGFVREGGSHEVWLFDGQNVPIPRHNEINERLAKGLIQDAKNH